ncbi:hypothetical protein BKA65DRAFT_555024 [Rhexocercosporidium sp. MPI-PUGE-AT-0058]|nr:hypothetical protein BKA65DRAFT_555024 [Rhexocercosporidium sp. MPI-PUGE-AT-0058]
MAEAQPPTIVEGATTGDVDDEIPVAAKSAEDRKAAAALSSLDTPRDDETASKDVDQEAKDEQKVVKKTVKVDPADVTLLIDELELSKIKATDLLKSHDGNAEAALRAYITFA